LALIPLIALAFTIGYLVDVQRLTIFSSTKHTLAFYPNAKFTEAICQAT
jgi:hypothetical protein